MGIKSQNSLFRPICNHVPRAFVGFSFDQPPFLVGSIVAPPKISTTPRYRACPARHPEVAWPLRFPTRPRPPPPNGRRTRDTHVSRAKIGPGAVLGVTQHLWLCLSGSTPRTGGVPFGCPLQPKRGNSQKMASHSLYPRKTTERVKWLAKLNRTRLKNCENCHPNDSFNVI